MTNQDPSNAAQIYSLTIKISLTVLGIILLLFFLFTIRVVLLIFIAAFIFSLALNPVVVFLESHRVARPVGSLLTFAAVIAVLVIAVLIVIPRIVDQGTTLFENLPGYIATLTDRALDFLDPVPGVRSQIEGSDLTRFIPEPQQLLAQLVTISTLLVGSVLFIVLFISIAIYSLIWPHSLLKGYLYLFPPEQ